MNYIAEMRKYIGHAPMLTAGATVIVLQENRILLNLRSDTGTWGIPGGSAELGETLEETAARELKEETNLTAGAFTLLHVFSGQDFYFRYPNGDELYSVIALYLAEHVTGELRITDGESHALRYFGLHELPPLESRAEKIIAWLAGQCPFPFLHRSESHESMRSYSSLVRRQVFYCDAGEGFANLGGCGEHPQLN